MATINPAQYVREVIGEVKKVTWPTKKETTVTTIMVFIMVALAAIFFMVVDLGLARSEEHTSELQSLMRISYAVFCLKKKKNKQTTNKSHHTHDSINHNA